MYELEQIPARPEINSVRHSISSNSSRGEVRVDPAFSHAPPHPEDGVTNGLAISRTTRPAHHRATATAIQFCQSLMCHPHPHAMPN